MSDTTVRSNRQADASCATVGCAATTTHSPRPASLLSRAFEALVRNRVVHALVLGFIALALFDFDQLVPSLEFIAGALVWIAPFLALSVVLAAALIASGADKMTARVFAGREGRMVAMAAAFGALSPFCSCGVVPLIAGLLAAGVPLAPVMAFWVASPIMDPEMFVLIAAGISLDFAVAKAIAALLLGLAAGYATLALTRRGVLANPIRPDAPFMACTSAPDDAPGDAHLVLRFWRQPARRRAFAGGAAESAWFLGRWLALAFFIESLMVAYVPADAFAAVIGGGGLAPIAGATLVGIPAYLNGYAAIPLVGRLMEFGMSPGAGMAFMLAGGITSIPAAMAVWALARKAVFAWYLLLAILGSFGFGAGYQMVLALV